MVLHHSNRNSKTVTDCAGPSQSASLQAQSLKAKWETAVVLSLARATCPYDHSLPGVRQVTRKFNRSQRQKGCFVLFPIRASGTADMNRLRPFKSSRPGLEIPSSAVGLFSALYLGMTTHLLYSCIFEHLPNRLRLC